MICVSWYAAAAYCNWLSRKENLPECYEPNARGQVCRWDEDPGRCLAADGLSVAHRG